jgi:molybdopterin molybdotransferase
MLSFDEALERVIGIAPRLEPERVALESAHRRVLAEDLRATAALPAFDASAMDGYAVSAADFPGAGPWEIPVIGESRTGQGAPPLTSESTCRIFTGAAIPSGADCVVAQEDVQRVGDAARFSARPTAGSHIRREGEDLAAGAVALGTGVRLGAYQLGLVAALDATSVVVSRAPRVTILCTGDELRAPGSPKMPGMLAESNSIVLRTLAESLGAVVTVAPMMRDDLDATSAAIAGALQNSDVLVTVGGVSVGDYDVVRPALERAGAHLDFWKVAIRPGKPLALGRTETCVVLGLPGNPVSAQVTFTLFGMSLLRAMQGDRAAKPRFVSSALSRPLRQQTGRRGFYRGVLDGSIVTPLDGQSSGATTSLPWANALIVLDEDVKLAAAGDTVLVLPLEVR